MATSAKPNILFIMADDIGWFNVSCYNHGIMGYRTPNIDRIAKEGAMFTDFYGQQSCTAGRAAFITGQSPIRTGLTKVGMPGATLGLSAEDPTIAQFLKNFGYATGQFGKNHLGDRNEHLPTVHGFDEFFGNLYHLNAEEEPEYPDYPKDPTFRKKFGPRGVLKCKATDKDDATVDPAVRQGRQADDREHRPADPEAHGDGGRGVPRRRRSTSWIARPRKARPGSATSTPTRMHVFTHLKPSSVGKTGLGLYPDGMVELDGYVGQLLEEARRSRRRRQHHRRLHHRQRRRGDVLAGRRRDAVPRREGHQLGRRLARALRHALARRDRARPRHQRHLLAAGLHPDLRRGDRRAGPGREGEEGLQDRRARPSRSISTAYNLMPFLSGKEEKSPREGFLYWSDDGD